MVGVRPRAYQTVASAVDRTAVIVALRWGRGAQGGARCARSARQAGRCSHGVTEPPLPRSGRLASPLRIPFPSSARASGTLDTSIARSDTLSPHLVRAAGAERLRRRPGHAGPSGRWTRWTQDKPSLLTRTRRRAELSGSPALLASRRVAATLDEVRVRLGFPLGTSLVVMAAPRATDRGAAGAVDSALTQSECALRSHSVERSRRICA